MAFDNELNRISCGGGFYDKYIKKSKEKNYYCWFAFISKSKIQTNKFDIKLDFIVTEKKRI